MFADFKLDFARRTSALRVGLSVKRGDGAERFRLNFDNELLRAMERERVVVVHISNAVQSIIAGFSEECGSVFLDDFFDIIDRFAFTGKAGNELAACGFVKFGANRQRFSELRDAGLGHVIGSNVFTGFGKATAFALFDSLAWRQHDVNVFTRHDSPVLFCRENVNGLPSQNVRQIKFFLPCKQIIWRKRFKYSHVFGRDKTWDKQKES